jgi:hypothetical protein
MMFRLPSRVSQAWPASTQSRGATLSKKAASQAKRGGALSARRTPKYISPSLLGGSISIFIYQGNNLAQTDGPFTVGETPTGYDFYCTYNPNTYQAYCSNTTPIFAPYGNDTFFAAQFDSQHHLLSITPGMPGSGFLSQTQPTYTITSSGYPSPIAINTYGVMSNFGVDASTSCVDRSFSGLYVSTDPFDSGGELLFGPLANPITVTATGGWSIAAQQLTSPYSTSIVSQFTFYDTSLYNLQLFAQQTGSQGSVSVSGNNASINTSGTSMNLIAVDRLAVSPVAGGLNVLGMVDSTASTYQCGTMKLATYDTATPVTFSNPVAVGSDDFYPGAVVVENISGTPYATVIDMYRGAFGLAFNTDVFEDAVPVVRVPLAGTNPIEVAVSPSDFGNSKVYVLNADGSVQSIDTSNGGIATVVPAASITSPAGIDVMYGLPTGGSDSLLITSSSTNNLYEIDNANTTPSLSMFALNTSAVIGVSSSATSTAVVADNLDFQGNFLIRANDPSASPQNLILSCFFPCSTDFSLNAKQFGSVGQAAEGAGTIGLSAYSGATYALVANAANVLPFWMFYDNQPQAGGPFNGSFSSAITRVVSTYDGVWNGFGYGGAFVFTYQLGATVYSPSLTGTRATIVSP